MNYCISVKNFGHSPQTIAWYYFTVIAIVNWTVRLDKQEYIRYVYFLGIAYVSSTVPWKGHWSRKNLKHLCRSVASRTESHKQWPSLLHKACLSNFLWKSWASPAGSISYDCLAWFTNYFSDRVQCVKSKSLLSGPPAVSMGVPQG